MEVSGERGSKPYWGLLYTPLDADGKQTESTPLRSSIFGKTADFRFNAKLYGTFREKK